MILDELLARIDTSNCNVHLISLVCTEDALRARLTKDIEAGKRTEDIIERSVARLSLYDKLATIKIDVSKMTAEQTADYIAYELN